MDMPMVDLGVLPCQLDAGIAHRAAIGLLVLATDQTMEHEFRHLVRQDGVALYEARLFNDNDVTPATLRAMRERIAPAAALILPGVKLDVVAFGCTSASMELGEDEVFRQIHAARPGVACTTPVTAAFAAFEALGAQRIGVLTPYSAEVNAGVRAYLTKRGATVAGVRHVQQAGRPRRRAYRPGVDRGRDPHAGAQHDAGRGVRLLHQSAAERDRCGGGG
jgi:maleate isomerase